MANPSASTPSAVFISCCETKSSEELIRRVFDAAEHEFTGTDGFDLFDGIRAHPLALKNKYYTANIHLCTMENRVLSNSQDFSEGVGAVVVYTNTTSALDALSKVETWLPFVNEFNPDVKILLVRSCTEQTAISFSEGQAWCLKNKFELVELDPQEDDDEEEDDVRFRETTGFPRVLQALHAHPWANLEMREGGSSRKLHPSLEAEASQEADVLFEGAMKDGYLPLNAEERNLVDESSDASRNGDFEQLFESFATMKERCDGLPSEERKEYAARVATAFFHAMSGTGRESNDLSSDEDEASVGKG